jgi:anthranilate/para-aminobenzoate synthase component II
MHGVACHIRHDQRGLFAGLPTPLAVARYHSLIVEPESLPAELEACAWTEHGELMAVRHRLFPATGLQFHPESFLTEHGARMLEHFVASLPPPESPRTQEAASLSPHG